VSAPAQERALEAWLANGLRHIGEIAIHCSADGTFELTHRDDRERDDLEQSNEAETAIKLARFDDDGNYRPLKTAPSLRHGWRLILANATELRLALDYFYPGRLAAFFAFDKNELRPTPLRATLDRQSGMYRIAAQLTDEQADELVGNFCRSDGGCLRTILWRRDRDGATPSQELPSQKFDPVFDQTGNGEPVVPLLCQEACNLLVAAARETVQARR
jgi:sirohydrochlorin cobaltochelatase